jgi:hypothetical protein
MKLEFTEQEVDVIAKALIAMPIQVALPTLQSLEKQIMAMRQAQPAKVLEQPDKVQ